jgi:hypothetical protein
VRAFRISKLCVPVAAALGRQVQEVVDRCQQIDSSFLDILGHPGMRGIDVAERAVTVSREDRDGRILVAVGVLAEQVVLERAGAEVSNRRLFHPRLRACWRKAGGSAAAAMTKSTFCAR